MSTGWRSVVFHDGERRDVGTPLFGGMDPRRARRSNR
jgi:hypothetical protein